ncbi:MAG: hypothetical protein MZV63_32810 [Marinilabiliales bacterium]|nr:hypothetical protein [Marinilabiliales bacterium]
MFEDGAIKVADMPAVLSAGVGIHPSKKFFIAAGMNYYFDKSNDYDGSERPRDRNDRQELLRIFSRRRVCTEPDDQTKCRLQRHPDRCK